MDYVTRVGITLLIERTSVTWWTGLRLWLKQNMLEIENVKTWMAVCFTNSLLMLYCRVRKWNPFVALAFMVMILVVTMTISFYRFNWPVFRTQALTANLVLTFQRFVSWHQFAAIWNYEAFQSCWQIFSACREALIPADRSSLFLETCKIMKVIFSWI